MDEFSDEQFRGLARDTVDGCDRLDGHDRSWREFAVPELLSIGSHAACYEQAGAFREMVVTHLFQVLSLEAPKSPTSLQLGSLVDETVKAVDSIVPLAPQDEVRVKFRARRSSEAKRR